jgi:signal recognition particle receptor subunit beta
MASGTSEPGTAVKILIAGGFGVGKTTMVGAVSEIPPMRTEELLTESSSEVDSLLGVPHKTTTTVALDFGRITISPELVLYLFGTPGQHRFWFMWDELTRGALGAVVLIDTRRLADSFAAVDFFEERGVPFVVGVNCFDGVQLYNMAEVRAALDLTNSVPLLLCDARDRGSARHLLTNVVQVAMAGFTAAAR